MACLFFDESQQPTCPHSRQRRRCTHVSPILKQSSQPFALGVTRRIWSRWVHCVAKIVSLPMFSDAFCQIGASCLDGRSSQARLRLPQRLRLAGHSVVGRYLFDDPFEQSSLHINYFGKKIMWVQEHDQACFIPSLPVLDSLSINYFRGLVNLADGLLRTRFAPYLHCLVHCLCFRFCNGFSGL